MESARVTDSHTSIPVVSSPMRGATGDRRGCKCASATGSAAPVAVLVSRVPLMILETSTGPCVPTGTGGVVASLMIPVTTMAAPLLYEWGKVTGSRVGVAGGVAVSGLASGGSSS